MITRGVIAGLVATLALSLIMMMKSAMGVMPAFDIISDWKNAVSALGMSINSASAWVLHFALGGLWGALYALFNARLPGSYVVSGIIVGVAAWLGMMIAFMPLAGNGLFALGISPVVTMATLVLHVFFGAVLGFTYSKLIERESLVTVTQ